MTTVHAVRDDIQGLRGIAVLLVVVFHTELALPGGFIGVDVFFAISGFVITRMLMREVERSGTIDLRRFYVRRVRRLLPALATMLVVVLIVMTIFTSPFGTRERWNTLTSMASSVFSSNMYLWWSGKGYFTPGVEQNFFLHTWSLSVEEQFYFVMPFLVFFVWRQSHKNRVRNVSVAVGALSVASFAIAELLLSNATGIEASQSLGFYSIFSRFWEIGAGVLVALVPVPAIRRPFADILAVSAIGVLFAAALLYGATTPFPGKMALVPILATVVLLLTGGTVVSAFLSLKILKRLGDHSYGWYLWHWPFIVLTREIWPDANGASALAACAAVLPAVASRRWIEERIRVDESITGTRALVLAGLCILGPLVVAFGVMKGAERRWGLEMPAGWKEASLALVRGCVDRAVHFDAEKCLVESPSSQGLVLLFGDSHAASLSDGVVAAASALQLDVAIMSTSGCPALIGREPTNKRCKEHQDAWLKALETLKPRVVVVANRSGGYTLPPGPKWRTIGGPRGEHPRNQAEALEFWRDGMRALLATLQAQGVQVVWVSVVPEFETRFDRYITMMNAHVPDFTVTKEVSDRRRGPVLAVERDVLADFANVSMIDPAEVLCANEVCAARVDDEWRYMDDNHLAPAGSRLLAPVFERALREALARPQSQP